MPWHRIIDADSELALGRLQIGTTRRGIGPAYADKALRVGIRVQDLLDEKILRLKIQTALSVKNELLRKLHHHRPLDKEELTVAMLGYAERICPFIADTSLDLDRALSAGRSVVAEGAQATLLDIDHGTYPFVTSSNPIAGGACTGLGVGPTRIDRVLGVTKAYLTRVGAGPFPSEADEERGAAIRERGAEYGTVTGRDRRCGWLDLVGLRYAARVNGLTELAVTKLDVLSMLESIPVCTAYRLSDGTVTTDFPVAPDRLPPRDAGLPGARRVGQRHLVGHHLRRPAAGRQGLPRAGRGRGRRADRDRRHRRPPRPDDRRARAPARGLSRPTSGSARPPGSHSGSAATSAPTHSPNTSTSTAVPTSAAAAGT